MDNGVWHLVARSGNTKGALWSVSQTPLVIGRDPACQVQVADPTVSRRHAQVYLKEGAPYFENLQAKNGALLNGNSIADSALNRGDEVTVGGCVFIVTQDAPDDSATGAGRTEETITISSESAWYLSEDLEELARHKDPNSLQNILSLYAFTRSLHRARTAGQLLDLLVEKVQAVLTPERVTVGFMKNDTVSFHPEVRADKNLVLLVKRTLEKKRSSIFVVRRKKKGDVLQFTMTAPLSLGSESVGAIVVESSPNKRMYEEQDLHLLVSIAEIVAPYLTSLETLSDLQCKVDELEHEVSRHGQFVGESEVADAVRRQASLAARSALPVLLMGETGTGKEVLAQLLHEHSARRDAPFVTVNCAAIPDQLFESEMFGHVKGAFTGAEASRAGHFERATGGTLFLDEIGNLSPNHQARILRVVEDGLFYRVGDPEPRQVDVRIISATNLDLKRAIEGKSFRADLYHRLNGFVIELPPLRERRSDVPLLATHFFRLFRSDSPRLLEGFAADCLDHMARLPWPGNVRELRNVVRRAVSVAQGPRITIEDCFFNAPAEADDDFLTLAEMERQQVEKALRLAEGNVTAAARLLGVHRNTLYNKIQHYGLNGA